MARGWLCLASAVLVLAGCASGSVSASPTPQAAGAGRAVVLALQRDARPVELAIAAASGGTGVDLGQALRRARESLATSRVPPGRGGEARLVLLSARDYENGAAVLEPRRVWLVTFRDAVFETDACACEGQPTRPSTAVAVDAADGSVVAAFGLSG